MHDVIIVHTNSMRSVCRLDYHLGENVSFPSPLVLWSFIIQSSILVWRARCHGSPLWYQNQMMGVYRPNYHQKEYCFFLYSYCLQALRSLDNCPVRCGRWHWVRFWQLAIAKPGMQSGIMSALATEANQRDLKTPDFFGGFSRTMPFAHEQANQWLLVNQISQPQNLLS